MVELARLEVLRSTVLGELGLPEFLEPSDLDSLARFEALLIVEETFGVVLEDSFYEHVQTWGDFHSNYVKMVVHLPESL